MKTMKRPELPGTTILTSINQQHKSILTDPPKGGKRITCKRRLLSLTVNFVLLTVVVWAGVGMFVGLQKLSSFKQGRFCEKEKERLGREIDSMCADDPIKCKSREWRRGKLDELAKCYGVPVGASKSPRNTARALMYLYSIYTTIGYGNVAATTPDGRIFAIVFALLGIPLFLGWLNHSGRWLHYWLVCAYERCRQWMGVTLTLENAEDGGLFFFTLLIFFAYLVAVSVVYMLVQDWSFWKSFYFAYQSVALIGFGDAYPEREDPWFVMFHLVATTIGILFLAMCSFVIRDWWAKIVEAITSSLAFKLNLKGGGGEMAAADQDTLRAVEASFTDAGTVKRPESSPKNTNKRKGKGGK